MQGTRVGTGALCKMSFPGLIPVSFLSLSCLLQTPVGHQMGQSSPGFFDPSCTGGCRKPHLCYDRHPSFVPRLPRRKCTFLLLSDLQQLFLPVLVPALSWCLTLFLFQVLQCVGAGKAKTSRKTVFWIVRVVLPGLCSLLAINFKE